MNFETLTIPHFDKEIKALSKKYRSIKDDLISLKKSLQENPFQGIELSPGIRKIRMAITSKGKGKSGGARIITYTVFVSELNGRVYLLDIYDKSDYSTIEVNVIKSLISELGL